jgi:hypothetical protein
MRLADFICAGAQKSGTTWLYAQISGHPQVFMQDKELNYFYRDLPPSWYQEQFAGASEGQLCGDISPNYAAFAGLAGAIHSLCPQARLLHLLRNPVDRAFSQWKMARYLGNIPRDAPFIEAFRQNMQFMKRRGEYAVILEEYARYYPPGDRLGVFWYDDISRRPAELFRDICSFLGIDSDWRPQELNAVVAPSPEKGTIDARDAEEVAAYYQPFDARLCAMLGLSSLPWSR